MIEYHQEVYFAWRKEVEAVRRRKVRRNRDERDYNSEQKMEHKHK
jgi:hypothetical protein